MPSYCTIADEGQFIHADGFRGIEYWMLKGQLYAAHFNAGDENPPTIRPAKVKDLKIRD